MPAYLSVVLSVYLCAGALFHGYFYETEFLIANALLFLACIPAALRVKSFGFVRLHAPFLVVVAFYWVSCWFAADRERALLEALKMTGVIPIVFCFAQLNQDGLKRMLHVWVWLGAALTILGIALGLERKGRLESTLDYANALAVLLLAAILAGALLFILERRNIHLAAMSLSAAGLCLTMSRSVWVLGFVAAAVLMVLCSAPRHKSAWLKIGISHLSGLALAMWIRSDPLFFWQRVQSIGPQTSEFRIRLVYWRDSIGMIRDHLWFGSGGGGWASLLPSYRSQDYFVRYVHNQFLQIALDAGAIALLAFLIWIGMAYIKGFRTLRNPLVTEKQRLLAGGCLLLFTVVLLHAGFDFDLGFPLLFALLAGLHALLSGGAAEPENGRLKQRRLIIPISTVLLLVFTASVNGWLAAGYLEKQAAGSLAANARYPEAQVSYTAAAKILPWSHTVRYESAKTYALAGNSSGDMRFYRQAALELDFALRLAPREDLYHSLLADLNKATQPATREER